MNRDDYRLFMEVVGWVVFLLRVVMEVARAVNKRKRSNEVQ